MTTGRGADLNRMTREKFSRKQTLDVRSAMAKALQGRLAREEFPGPQGKARLKFARVFSEWPTSGDVAILPSAAVLSSEDPVRYAGALLTPTLLEETWEPRGRAGLGLYRLSEAEADFRVEVRARTQLERAAIVAHVEALLFAPRVLLNRPAGARYGCVEEMPDYWGLPARFWLREKTTGDDPAGAKAGRWEATFAVSARAPHVRLDRVYPFRVKITEVFE